MRDELISSATGSNMEDISGVLKEQESAMLMQLAKLHARNDELISKLETRANRLWGRGKDLEIEHLQKRLQHSQSKRQEEKAKRKAAKQAERDRRQTEERQRLGAVPLRSSPSKSRRLHDALGEAEKAGKQDMDEMLAHLSVEDLATMSEQALQEELDRLSGAQLESPSRSTGSKEKIGGFSSLLGHSSAGPAAGRELAIKDRFCGRPAVSRHDAPSPSNRLAPLDTVVSTATALMQGAQRPAMQGAQKPAIQGAQRPAAEALDPSNEDKRSKHKAVVKQLKQQVASLQQELCSSTERENELSKAFSYMEQKVLYGCMLGHDVIIAGHAVIHVPILLLTSHVRLACRCAIRSCVYEPYPCDPYAGRPLPLHLRCVRFLSRLYVDIEPAGAPP